MSGPGWKWRKMEPPDLPAFIRIDDECYHARERLSKGGFKASETNQLIDNLKKDPSTRGTPQWKWKQKAIRQFASELADVFNETQQYLVSAIPTSTVKSDPTYDSRLDDALSLLVRARPLITIDCPLQFLASHTPQHRRDDRMSPQEIYELLEWTGFAAPPGSLIVLIDDVITCGAHFKACKRMILDHHPTLRVIGAFWAKTIWTAPPAA